MLKEIAELRGLMQHKIKRPLSAKDTVKKQLALLDGILWRDALESRAVAHLVRRIHLLEKDKHFEVNDSIIVSHLVGEREKEKHSNSLFSERIKIVRERAIQLREIIEHSGDYAKEMAALDQLELAWTEMASDERPMLAYARDVARASHKD